MNNAGISGVSAPTDWQTVEEYKRGIDVNLMGMIRVTLAFLSLVKRTHGRVINMSSVCGRIALSSGSYCVSKYGVEAFSDSLRCIAMHSHHYFPIICLIKVSTHHLI